MARPRLEASSIIRHLQGEGALSKRPSRQRKHVYHTQLPNWRELSGRRRLYEDRGHLLGRVHTNNEFPATEPPGRGAGMIDQTVLYNYPLPSMGSHSRLSRLTPPVTSSSSLIPLPTNPTESKYMFTLGPPSP